jgi:hypothetical protein
MAFSIVSFNANHPKSASNTAIADLTKTFRLSPKYGFGKGLREVHEASGDPSRQRRAHRKSKDGCVECKKRRVKVCRYSVAEMRQSDIHYAFLTTHYLYLSRADCVVVQRRKSM